MPNRVWCYVIDSDYCQILAVLNKAVELFAIELNGSSSEIARVTSMNEYFCPFLKIVILIDAQNEGLRVLNYCIHEFYLY